MNAAAAPCEVQDLDFIPVLVLTDDGRDVDDLEAWAYLEGDPRTKIVAAATTHMIPDRRAFIVRAFATHLGNPDVPTGVGSIFPLGQEDESLLSYLRGHTIQGKTTYEGDGLIECFPSAEDIIVNAVRKYGKRLRIASLAPATDLAKVNRKYPGLLEGIGGLYIQGQATIEDGRLVPSMEAYNFSEDPEAIRDVFELQDDVPFTLVGKWAAYQVALHRPDFDAFEATGNPAGLYLKDAALKGIQAFATRTPNIFQRVFGIEPDQLHTLSELSKPYDALVAMALAGEEFDAEHIGPHTLIGMTRERHGIRNPQRTKQKLVDTILYALSRTSR